MRLIGSLIGRLQGRIARYKPGLDYADAKERRRPTPEIEWNGEMIGELGRRSSDAFYAGLKESHVSKLGITKAR
jgi:hypothetical protein